MKRIATLTVILSLLSSTYTMAQVTVKPENESQDSTATEEKVVQEQAQTKTVGPEDSVEVVISPKKDQDSTIVRVGGMKIIVLDEDDSDDDDDSDGFVFDTIEDDSIEVKGSKKKDPVHHWAGIRVGIDGYLYQDGLPMPATHDYMELDYARSIGMSFNLFEKDFRLVGNYVELVTGLGFDIANYTFESDYATIQSTNPITAAIDSSRVLEKNRLKAYYITAPLMLGFSTHEDQSKAFRLAAGAQVAWRVGSRLKQRYTMNGETFKPKVRSDYNLNPFQFAAIASVGYGPLNVYASYGLNPLFEENKGPELYPFSTGLQLMF